MRQSVDRSTGKIREQTNQESRSLAMGIEENSKASSSGMRATGSCFSVLEGQEEIEMDKGSLNGGGISAPLSNLDNHGVRLEERGTETGMDTLDEGQGYRMEFI